MIGPIPLKEAAAEKEIGGGTEGDACVRVPHSAKLILREIDRVTRHETLPHKTVLLVNTKVILAVGKEFQHGSNLGGILRQVSLNPAVRVLLGQSPGHLQLFMGAAEGEARSDAVETAVYLVKSFQKLLGTVVKTLRGISIGIRCRTFSVDPCQSAEG